MARPATKTTRENTGREAIESERESYSHFLWEKEIHLHSTMLSSGRRVDTEHDTKQSRKKFVNIPITTTTLNKEEKKEKRKARNSDEKTSCSCSSHSHFDHHHQNTDTTWRLGQQLSAPHLWQQLIPFTTVSFFIAVLLLSAIINRKNSLGSSENSPKMKKYKKALQS